MMNDLSESRDRSSERSFPIGPRIATGVMLMILLVIGCGGWAALARLDSAVIAPGSVTVDQNIKEVQHRDGGIVKSIFVRQGDLVKAGRIILALDDTQVKAELLIARSQLVEALGRKARLAAERDKLSFVTFPGGLDELSASAEEIKAGENHLFLGNKLSRDSQKEQLTLSVSQTSEEIIGMEARLSAKMEEITLVGAEREKLTDLYIKKITEYARVYSINREWARLLGERGEIEAGIARTKVRANEIRVQIIAIDHNASTEAQRELRTVDPRISELQERILAIEDRLSRMEVRAPVTGYVNELFVSTVGGVVTPAAKIVTIVPENAELKFEIRVSPVDIDQVREGQSARVRLTAFSRSTTPELFGKVTFVSPASTRDPRTGQEYYVAYVQLVEEAVSRIAGMKLMPGMPAEVFVATDERTAVSYLLKPFSDQMNRALRER